MSVLLNIHICRMEEAKEVFKQGLQISPNNAELKKVMKMCDTFIEHKNKK